MFLIAPNTLYRNHNHAAPELYAPLAGPHGWRFESGAPLTWKPAHHIVWNEPYQHHAIKAGAVPFQLIFSWTRDVRKTAQIIPESDWALIEQAPSPAS